MSTRITIAFDSNVHPETVDSNLVHRLRNFGEDLYREFSTSGFAEISLNEVDSATSELRVVRNAKRHIGVVSAFIRKTLQQHKLDDQFTVTRG